MNPTRTIPLRRVTVSTQAGADPDAIDDAETVYADERDVSLFAFPPCPRNGDGYGCEYADALNPDRCLYCGEPFDL